MSTIYRMTISIPKELKKQMDAIEEPVNWSAVATASFRAKLVEMAATEKKQTMQDLIQQMQDLIQQMSRTPN